MAQLKGEGLRAQYASTAAKNMHAFEILVGPYAVAHLRLTEQILREKGQIPSDGVHVYLTDTLESPNQPPPHFPFLYRPLGEEHERAQKVKAKTPVLVCIGNPPYDRQQILDSTGEKRKGGWIRYGDEGSADKPLLDDFLEPLTESDMGVHAKNLYNDYIYFWRWALWKVFETGSGPGIVSFITASSYLRGPGFVGVRQVMRERFDELWIIDLEGDSLGARKTENVFSIRTPVAIATGIRYHEPNPHQPATVHYTRVTGTRDEKLSRLADISSFQDLHWKECLTDWMSPFLPVGDTAYWDWPLLTDLFPWQENGMQFKRTWPIGESREVLTARWRQLVSIPVSQRGKALRETGARRISNSCLSLDGPERPLPPIATLGHDTPPLELAPYAYRSFDRQWMLRDNRLCDRPRPSLQATYGPHQVYLTSLLTKVLGEGPAATATALIPDMDCFCGRGARDVIPLWRNSAASDANVVSGALELLSDVYGHPVSAEDFFAYCYAILCTPRYVTKYWDELTIPGPRIPITKDTALFDQAVVLGRHLLWLHTYGERFVPDGAIVGKLPPGVARCRVGTPTAPDQYPNEYEYDRHSQELRIGGGVFENVRPEVWEFSVSGLQIVQSWLGYRMRKRSGRSSSPLDDIRPSAWGFDEELLDLLWVLDHTVDMLPSIADVLEAIAAGELFVATDFAGPTEAERRGPRGAPTETPLFDQAGIQLDVDDEEEDG